MKLKILIFVLFYSFLYAWDGTFAISCGNNSWIDPNNIAGANAAWKFNGTGNSAGTNSPNKYLILQGKTSPSNPGEISSGNFYFRIIERESGDAWYSWGGDGTNDEAVTLNSSTLITCPNGNYQSSKAANFTVSDSKYYALLFPANPNGGNSQTKLVVLEFDGQPSSLSSQSHNLNGTNIDLTLNLGATPPADQKFYVRYVWDGSNDWANATITPLNVSGTTATVSIPVGTHSSIAYYYFTTETNPTITNTNANEYTLYYLNNSGSNYTVGALPVELTNLNATFVKDKININWTTLTEVNNSGFEIEKLTNNIWQKIGFIQGANNSNKPINYTYQDININSGINKYRLKQIDNNGNFKYSNEVEVFVAAPQKFDLLGNFPNPFNPNSVIKFQVAKTSLLTLKLYNVNGQLVKVLLNDNLESGIYSYNLNMDNLPSGIYFVTMNADNFNKTIKINFMK